MMVMMQQRVQQRRTKRMQAMKMWAGKKARMTAMAMRAMEKKNAMEMMRTTRTTTMKRSSSRKSTAERSFGPDWP